MIKLINLPDKHKNLIYEMKTYMHDLLLRTDKLNMAHSIETRVPFLDNNLVEYSLSYLANSNFDYSFFPNINKNTKKYLKKISTNYFGKSLSYRSKSGFSFPLKKWLALAIASNFTLIFFCMLNLFFKFNILSG